MRALLVTAGSRGDVAPFLALARHGVARGDEVHLAVTREARDDADRTGAVVHGLDGDFAALIAAQGTSPWTALRTYRTTMAPMLAAIERSAVAAALAAAPDVLLTHPKILTAGAIAARRGRPWVRAEIVPTLTPTRDFPAAGLPVPDVPALNPLTFRALAAGARLGERAARRRVERDIGPLPPGAAPTRTVVPVSPVLLPRPDDWPATTVVTGRWVDPPDGAAGPPDPELDDFLAAGDVHYAGFGSMARGDPRARARTIVDVLRARGARVLLVTGWGGLEVPDDLAGPDVLVRRRWTTRPCCRAAPPRSTTPARGPPTPWWPRACRRCPCRCSPTSRSGRGGCTRPGWRGRRCRAAVSPPRGWTVPSTPCRPAPTWPAPPPGWQPRTGSARRGRCSRRRPTSGGRDRCPAGEIGGALGTEARPR